MSEHGTYEHAEAGPAVRFERFLRQPVEAVWRVITDPSELRHWFPCAVELELRVGGPMTFTFSPGVVMSGEVLELDPPSVFAFRWDEDVLRFTLAADGGGTRLAMVHVLNGEGAPGAARTAAGWHLCLDAMEARVAGEHDGEAPGGPSPEWRRRYDEYLRAGVPSGAEVPG